MDDTLLQKSRSVAEKLHCKNRARTPTLYRKSAESLLPRKSLDLPKYQQNKRK